MNWLSRFLHIKPASKTLCLQVGRGKVRQDLVRLLRDWQRFGIQDVALDRKSNSISARVDRNNRKCSPSSQACFVFCGWRLQNRRVDIEVLRVKQTLQRNATFHFLIAIRGLKLTNIHRLEDQAGFLCH